MSTETTHPQLWDSFDFYLSGGDDGSMDETMKLNRIFKLTEVRVVMATKHLSVEDFVIWLSSGRGAAFSQILISQAFSDVKDYLWMPEEGIMFNSSDNLHFSLFIKSTTNTWALTAKGWAVQVNV